MAVEREGSAKARLVALHSDKRNRLHWFNLPDLAAEFQVSEAHIERIYRELIEEGYVVEKRRDGDTVMYKATSPHA